MPYVQGDPASMPEIAAECCLLRRCISQNCFAHQRPLVIRSFRLEPQQQGQDGRNEQQSSQPELKSESSPVRPLRHALRPNVLSWSRHFDRPARDTTPDYTMLQSTSAVSIPEPLRRHSQGENVNLANEGHSERRTLRLVMRRVRSQFTSVVRIRVVLYLGTGQRIGQRSPVTGTPPADTSNTYQ